MGLSGGGCADNKAGLITPCFAFCFQYANPATAVFCGAVKKAEIMPVSGKSGAGFRQSGQGKTLPHLYPVRHGGDINAGGDCKAGGGGVCFRKGKG